MISDNKWANLYIREHIYIQAKKELKTSPEFGAKQKELFDILLHTVEYPRKKRNKKQITGLDAYFVNTEPLQDNDGKILIGILGGSSEKLLIIKKEGEKQHIELTDDGIAKLNYILNRVARHTRRNGIGLPFFKKYLEPRCKIEQDYDSNKKKVYFCIKDVKKFRTFLNYLTTFKDIDQFDDSKDHAAFILNEKKALFIKNLLCFIDLEKDEVFKERRALFQKVIQSVFGKFFRNGTLKKYPVKECINEKFTTNITEREIPIELIGNFKSQERFMDKQRRDSTYTGIQVNHDTDRYQIAFENHKDLLEVLRHFIKFYQLNPEKIFGITADTTLEKLQIKDKGILDADERENKMKTLNLSTISENEENIKIKLIESLNKSGREKAYRDVKLLLPVNISGKAFTVEVKFVLNNRKETNETGVYHHAVFALEQKIKLASRDKKFVLKTDIKEACKQVIKNNPELIKQLSKEKEHPISEEETIEKVYHFLLKKTLPLAIPGYENEAVMHIDIYKILEKNSFLLSALQSPTPPSTAP